MILFLKCLNHVNQISVKVPHLHKRGPHDAHLPEGAPPNHFDQLEVIPGQSVPLQCCRHRFYYNR